MMGLTTSSAFVIKNGDADVTDNYEVTNVVDGFVEITKVAKEIVITAASDSKEYDGTPLTKNEYSYTEDVLAEGDTLTAVVSGTVTNVGTADNKVVSYQVMRGNTDVTSCYTFGTSVDGTLEVTQRTLTLLGKSDTLSYNGKEQSITGYTAGANQLLAGHVITASAKASGTSAGTYPGSITAAADVKIADASGNDVTANYNITTIAGTLTITKISTEIIITANSNSKTYDGAPLTDAGFSCTENVLAEGDVLEATVEGSAVNVGDAGANVVTGYKVTRDGKDVTDNYTFGTPVNGKLKINKRKVILTSATDQKEYDGTALINKKIEVTGDGWADEEGSVYYVTGSQTVAGSSQNAFTYDLNNNTDEDNYDIETVFGTLTVGDRTAKYEITVEANADEVTYDGDEHSVSGFKTLEFTVNGQTYKVEGLSASASGTDAGTYTAEAEGTAVVKDADGNDVTAHFIVKTTDGQLKINKRTVTLKSADLSKGYDGTALENGSTALAAEEGWVDGEGAVYEFTGSQKVVGTSANSFTYTLNEGTKADNYEINKTEGTLSVTSRDAQYEITVTASSKTETYDGSEKSVSGFESMEFTVAGQTYTVSGLKASVSGTDAGSYTSAITGTAVVKDAEGTDVTAQFAVKTTNGTLKIEKRKVTLTSAADQKEYDGTALTNDTVTVSGDGFAAGEGASYKVTGSQTLVGSSENTFTYSLNEGTDADNYEISTSKGTLTVTNRNTKYAITVEANSGEYKYDGKPHTAEGFKTLEFTENGQTYTVSGLTASTTETNAGTYTVNVVGTPVVTDAKGNDVSAQFSVSTTAGTLEITKRSVTLTSATDSKTYDGTVLKNDTVTVSGDGFAEGEGASYDVTGSQKLVGNSQNSFTYTLKAGTNEDNYDISTQNGTLTVTDRSEAEKYEITVEANSDEVTYDGKGHSVSGFKTLDFTVNGQKYKVEGLSASASGTDADTYTAEAEGTAVVKDADGNDVTAQFIVKTTDGQLKINKRTVTLKSADLSKEYDGTALENGSTVLAVEDGWADGEGAVYEFTGSQLNVGESQNSFTYTLDSNTKASNYDIKVTAGTLKVTENLEEILVKLKGKTSEVIYKGEEQSVTGYEVISISSELYKENDFEYTGDATAAGTNADTYQMNLDESKFRNISSNFSNIKFEVVSDGWIKIKPAALTVVTGSAGKIYDGQSAVSEKASITGFVKSETATITATGSQIDVGSSKNTYEVTWDHADKNNYTITVEVLGTLTVTAKPVTIVVHNAWKNYDDADPEFTGAITGLVQEDALGEITYGRVEADKSKTDVGDSITITVFYTPNQNYDVEVTDGKLEIVQSGSMALITQNGSKVYDAEPLESVPAVTNAAGAKIEYRIKGETEWSEEAPDITNVQKITVEVRATHKNYTEKTAEYTLEVTHMPVTVTADNQTKAYGAKEPELTATVSETKNGDEIEYTVDREMGEYVGSYEIKADGDEIQGNYKVTYLPAVFMITDQVLSEAVVTKTHESKEYGLGDVITFTINVTNVYAETRTVTIEEQKNVILAGSSDGRIVKELAAGDSMSVTADYVVTEEDLIAQTFTNNVTVTFAKTPKNPEKPYAAQDTVPEEELDDVERTLTVTKKVVDSQKLYIAGDTIKYEISVKNDGNLTLSDVVLEDTVKKAAGKVVFTELNGASVNTDNSVEIGTLAPGEEITLLCEYEIVRKDAGKTLTNTAFAAGTDPTNTKVEGEGSAKGIPVDRLYKLVIRYVNCKGRILTKTYTGYYVRGEQFEIESPKIKGYTTNVAAVKSGADGMPGEDLEFEILYNKIPTEPENGESISGNPVTPTPIDTPSRTIPEKTPEETIPEEPEDARVHVIEPDDDCGYNLTPIDEAEETAAEIELDDHRCCMLHFLLMLAGFVVAIVHMRNQKKRQARIFELREKIEIEKFNRGLIEEEHAE